MAASGDAAIAAAAPKAAAKPAAPKQSKALAVSYSKAFDNFVGDNPDDVEGLLGYALYKRSIREQCKNGGATDGVLRNPPDKEVEVYRSAARAMIETVMEDFESLASEQWKQSHYDKRLETWKGEIKAMIRGRTTLTGAILSNMIAWVITLAITLLVYFGLKATSVEDQIAAQVDRELARQQARPAASATGSQGAPGRSLSADDG
ncbi:MAG: hypothetical protein K0M78_06210 [Brevundimonas sp.]|nr:hypothetical protein [Brevundimonas sp.]